MVRALIYDQLVKELGYDPILQSRGFKTRSFAQVWADAGRRVREDGRRDGEK